MAVCVKVWSPDTEPRPRGLFNKSTCPKAPPHWFKEEPEYAAELFGLETRKSGRVHVLDSDGRLHMFEVEVGVIIDAKVRRLGIFE